MANAKLLLRNGQVFYGEGFGALNSLPGEMIFNTSMTGYQEILTDASYCDQIVVLTNPLIGNYGICRNDYERSRSFAKGLVVREVCKNHSHWDAEKSLDRYLVEQGIPGISDIDTRMLTKMIRDEGVMPGIIAPAEIPDSELMLLLKRPMPRREVARVGTRTIENRPAQISKKRIQTRFTPKIVVFDFGCKEGILKSLSDCDVVLVPYDTGAEEIDCIKPDGIVLSNGPGDPADLPQVLPVIQALQQRYPIFGICLGHQLFALANDARTYKLKFGHRGANHPVKDLLTGRTHMTSQNHGYAVDKVTVEKNANLEITHIDINDDVIQGLRHKKYPSFSVQFHPEARPGPHDTHELFTHFLNGLRG